MPYAAELLQALLRLRFPFILKLPAAMRSAFGGAPVRLGDEVFDVAGPDAPDASATDLDPAPNGYLEGAERTQRRG
jgi:hypothetical protein